MSLGVLTRLVWVKGLLPAVSDAFRPFYLSPCYCFFHLYCLFFIFLLEEDELPELGVESCTLKLAHKTAAAVY